MADRDMQAVRPAIGGIMGREQFAQSADLDARIAIGLDVKILRPTEPVHGDLVGFRRMAGVGNRLLHQIGEQLRHDGGANEVGRLQKGAGFRAKQLGSTLIRDRRCHYSGLRLGKSLLGGPASRSRRMITGMPPSRAG